MRGGVLHVAGAGNAGIRKKRIVREGCVHLHAEHPLSYRNAVFPSLSKDLEYGVSNIRHETAGGRDGAA